jgi:hypothetical protein
LKFLSSWEKKKGGYAKNWRLFHPYVFTYAWWTKATLSHIWRVGLCGLCRELQGEWVVRIDSTLYRPHRLSIRLRPQHQLERECVPPSVHLLRTPACMALVCFSWCSGRCDQPARTNTCVTWCVAHCPWAVDMSFYVYTYARASSHWGSQRGKTTACQPNPKWSRWVCFFLLFNF